jgi:hypothetical protein
MRAVDQATGEDISHTLQDRKKKSSAAE